IVDRVDVVPRLAARIFGRFDHTEMNAVGKSVASANDEYAGGLRRRPPNRAGQAAAVTGRHCPVVEVERHHSHAAESFIGDLSEPGFTVVGADQLGYAVEILGQSDRCRELDRPIARSASRPHLANPDGAVTGSYQHRTVLAGGDRAGLASWSIRPGQRVINEDVLATQSRAYAGRTVRGTYPPDDIRRRIRPGERSVTLSHAGSSATAHSARPLIGRRWNEVGIGRFSDDISHQSDGRVGDRTVVQAALPACSRNRKRAGCQYRAIIEFANCLQGRDAPRCDVIGDRPVQGSGPPIADRAGMNDDRPISLPKIVRNALAKERTNDKGRIEYERRRPDRVHVGAQLHSHVVTGCAQVKPYSLGQPVEGRAEQHHPHGASRAVVHSSHVQWSRGDGVKYISPRARWPEWDAETSLT